MSIRTEVKVGVGQGKGGDWDNGRDRGKCRRYGWGRDGVRVEVGQG